MVGHWSEKFTEWLKRPYSDEMSVVGWFMFFGLVMVITFLWSTILRKIELS